MPMPDFQTLRAQAELLGFADFTVLQPPPILEDATQKLSQWLEMGHHADMQWMQHYLEKRQDPQQLMPETQAICLFTVNYYPGDFPENTSYKIARYAWGKDYHLELKQKLKTWVEALKKTVPTLKTRVFTDSAPLLEKPMAVQAGLGWQGKNTCLIHPQRGSWFFIAEVLFSEPVPNAPELEPITDHCGRCRRCIDACPTGALDEPYTLDSNKCIAYWTIESKAEAFPPEIENNLDDWIFGCDICQEVCPWNQRFQKKTDFAAFQADYNDLLQSVMQSNDATFTTQFSESPLSRSGYGGLQRNLAAVEKNKLT